MGLAHHAQTLQRNRCCALLTLWACHSQVLCQKKAVNQHSQLQLYYVQVVAALRRALADFFGSKKSRLSRKLLEGCLRAHPGAAAALLPDVLGAAEKGRTPYLRVEALALLSGMLRPPKVRCGVRCLSLRDEQWKALSFTTRIAGTAREQKSCLHLVDAVNER